MKRVTAEEIDAVMCIIQDAISLLGKVSLQWQCGYPNRSTLLEDIAQNRLYGCYIHETLVGVVAVVEGVNEDYLVIDNGEWLSPTSRTDVVLHRVAVKKEFYHQKIGKTLLTFGIEEARRRKATSVKIDTHPKNKPMQHVIQECGFIYCGVIYIQQETVEKERLAYEILF